MKRALASALAAASIIASAPLFAQQANSQPSAVQAGDYALDSAHTLVRFTVDHFGISEFFGTFPGATGTLSIDPTDIASAKLDVSVPVETVSTTNATLDEELVGEEWFDAEKFPTMRFVSTKVVKTGERTADVTVRYRYEAALYIMPDGAEPDAALTSVSRVTGEDGSEFLELAIASNGTMRAILDEPSIILSGSDGSTYTIEGEEAAALQGLNVLPGAERRVQIPLPQQLFAGPLTGTLETRYIILQ